MSVPAGTVTFLFTDIESSTQLLRELGDDYQQLLADHRRILRERFGEVGGTEVDNQGDALFFSFPRARNAVEGAVAGQRALAAHEWPGGADVRVRMGLHTGEPAVGEEGYVGLDVVRAARICSAGNGGQILLSETTRALLGNELPAGASVRDLGRHELKDVQEERIFELAFDGGGPSPALKTSGRSRADDIAESFEQRIESYVAAQLERALADPGGRDLASPPTKLALSGLLIAFAAILLIAGVVVAIIALLKLL